MSTSYLVLLVPLSLYFFYCSRGLLSPSSEKIPRLMVSTLAVFFVLGIWFGAFVMCGRDGGQAGADLCLFNPCERTVYQLTSHYRVNLEENDYLERAVASVRCLSLEPFSAPRHYGL